MKPLNYLDICICCHVYRITKTVKKKQATISGNLIGTSMHKYVNEKKIIPTLWKKFTKVGKLYDMFIKFVRQKLFFI